MTKISEILSDSINDMSDHDYIKKYAKQMLRNSLFIGTFQEKRFVEQLNSYRDVITIAGEEDDFINNLLIIKKKIDDGFIERPWLGITEPNTIGAPVGYNLWVELKEEVFGKYWYKVKTVDFHENEIRLKLDIIRPVKHDNSPSRTNTSNAGQSIDSIDFKNYFNDTWQVLRLNLKDFCSAVLTFQNFKESVIFVSLLIGAIITGGISIIRYLLEYILKLIREISFLIKAISPIIMTSINLIGKSIFGFYSMIVALYRHKQTSAPVYNAYLQYDPNMDPYFQSRFPVPKYSDRELQYYPNRRSKSGVKITPLT